MLLTRRDFIKSTSILAGGILLGASKLSALQQDLGKGFKLINDNIGIFTERGGTILWYVSKEGAAIVDAQFPDSARNLMDGLKKKTSRKIDFLFNTHHHADHTAGNFYLKDFVNTIAANENCARLQKEKNGGGEKDKTQAYPNFTFKEHSSFDLGKERVEAYHYFPGHTGGDSIYHFVNSNVVHMGDLVFNGLCPYFFITDEGSFRTWIKFLDKVHGQFPNDTKFIFGHSADPEKVIGTRDDLAKMKNYIAQLLDYVEKEKSAGKTKEQISASINLADFKGYVEPRPGMLKTNAEMAYEELSR